MHLHVDCFILHCHEDGSLRLTDALLNMSGAQGASLHRSGSEHLATVGVGCPAIQLTTPE